MCLLCKMSYREVARERTQFLMTHLQISAIPTRVFFSARKFHQFDYSINALCGLQLMVRVEVLGSVNPNPNPNPNPNRIYNPNRNPN